MSAARVLAMNASLPTIYSADGERVLYSASWGQRLTTSPGQTGGDSR